MTDGAPVGRRVVLGMLGAGALGVVAGGPLSSTATSAFGALARHDPSGVSSLLPTGGWRYYTVTGEPTRTAADYRLAVGGLVDRPSTLTLADLQAIPATRLTRDFQCVTGWRVPDVHWTGVRVADLLDRAGVQPTATALRFLSFDGVYTESLTLEQARRDDVLVAYGMGDGPVSHHHGGPVRLLVAPMYGYKSCKWLGGIQLTSAVVPGYWEHYGYDVDGWVGRSNFRDDPPT